MSNHAEIMGALIRSATRHQPAEPEPEPAVPDFDGGARTSAPTPAPDMSRLLRAAVRTGPPDTAAERWLREH